MGLLDGIKDKTYYEGGDLGNYQFISLEDVINQFIVAYVGEGKIIQKVKRTDVAFHAQRALQEFSYDTLKSVKSQEIEVPPSLTMALPIDYVNYTGLATIDSSGIEHVLYPISKTSNPLQISQDSDENYSYDTGELITNHAFDDGTNNWTLSQDAPAAGKRIDVSTNNLEYLLVTQRADNSTAGSGVFWQKIDVTGVDSVTVSGEKLLWHDSLATHGGSGVSKIGLAESPFHSDGTIKDPDLGVEIWDVNTDETLGVEEIEDGQFDYIDYSGTGGLTPLEQFEEKWIAPTGQTMSADIQAENLVWYGSAGNTNNKLIRKQSNPQTGKTYKVVFEVISMQLQGDSVNYLTIDYGQTIPSVWSKWDGTDFVAQTGNNADKIMSPGIYSVDITAIIVAGAGSGAGRFRFVRNGSASNNIVIDDLSVKQKTIVGGEFGSRETTVDVSEYNELYFVLSETNDATTIGFQNSRFDNFSVVDNDRLDNLLLASSSDSWENYKSHIPSENNNDDYEDDTYWPNMGGRYGLDPSHSQVNGSFYMDNLKGKIHFSSNLSGKTIVLKYISDSLGSDKEMQVHKFAEEAMYKYIIHAILSTRVGVPEYVIQRFNKEKFAAKRLAKLRLSNLKIEELTQVLRGKSKQIKH